MRRTVLMLCAAAALNAAGWSLARPPALSIVPIDPAPEARDEARPRVQIALLLDTSNSMDGLIHQAKTQLWKMVNELRHCRRGGVSPILEVALYEYGNNGLPESSGWVRRVASFTTDLDRISHELFALQTNGGSEHCGQVMHDALRDLPWRGGAGTYRAIFIAGNEPFTQGPVDYRQVCEAARSRGVVVNTIHCGGREDGIRGMWQDGASIAGGRYASIDQDHKPLAIDTPYDAELSKLSRELNGTYLPYGDQGAARAALQASVDGLAILHGEAGMEVERAVAKAGAQYRNEEWDLVDAVRERRVDVASLPAAELPAALRAVPAERRSEEVEKFARQREDLRRRVAHLATQRDAFLAQQAAEQAPATLDAALSQTLRAQARDAGFEFIAP